MRNCRPLFVQDWLLLGSGVWQSEIHPKMTGVSPGIRSPAIIGRVTVGSLLTRTTYYEGARLPVDLCRYHVDQMDVAGLYLTETIHPAAYQIPLHAHHLESLYLVLSGSMTEKLGRESVTREAGDLVYIPPGELHSERFHGRGGHCVMIELQPIVAARIADCGRLPASPVSLSGPSVWLARRLFCEFKSYDSLSPMVLEGISLELFAQICHEHFGPQEQYPLSKIDYAQELLDQRFAQSISLAEVAREVGLHPVYLARLFRRRHRCSVGEYLRRRRTEFACLRLANSRKPLVEIASEAGFCDQAHLTRTFRTLLGCTPADYRRRVTHRT